MGSYRKTRAPLVALGCLLLLLDGCRSSEEEEDKSGEDTEGMLPVVETTTVNLSVSFSNEMQSTVTQSLHVWILQPRKSQMDLSCRELVGKLIDPYDVRLLRLADHVTTRPGDPLELEGVELGDAFVYVEGVNVVGKTEVAGCTTATLVQPSTSVTIALGPAGVFDCADPATEDGAPCDDGKFCTTGETCQNGACQGGRVRDCSILADQCSAASCSETQGCVVEGVPNGTPCNDGLSCTINDGCQDGTCVGAPRDCDAQAGECMMAIGCSEPQGECLFASVGDGEPCDDGLFCTIDTYCTLGVCSGSPRSCPDDDECNVGQCDEQTKACTIVHADVTASCTDPFECTQTFGFCDGVGVCNAAPANEGGDCDNGGDPGVCEAGACVEPPPDPDPDPPENE